MRVVRLLGAGVLAVVLAVGVGSARGMVTIGPDGDEILGPGEAQAAKLLGPDFKDEIHGFRIRTPAGARIAQQKGTQASQERLSFVLDDKQWAGQIEAAFFKPANFSPEEYLKSSAQTLNQNFRAVQILESRVTTVSGKPAARLIASVEATGKVVQGGARDQKEVPIGKLSLLKQELAVQVGTNEYLVLTLYGPLAMKDDLLRTFTAMAGTFTIYEKKQVEEERKAAIQAGRAWFLERSAEELASKLVPQAQLFRIKVDGKDMGYVRFDEKEEKGGVAADDLMAKASAVGGPVVDSEVLKGISVFVNSRTFPESGSVVMSQNHAFWAYGRQDPSKKDIMQFSRWENNLKEVTLVGNKSAASWSTESGILQFQVLRAARSPTLEENVRGGRFLLSVSRDQGNDAQLLTERGTRAPQQWEISLDMPTALPKAMEYLWPRVVDLSKPSKMAFVVFNSNSNPGKLGLRTLSVIGPDTVNIDGQSTRATRLLDEMDPGSTTMWVDSGGRILMMRTSDGAILAPTTEQRMTELWYARQTKVLNAPVVQPK